LAMAQVCKSPTLVPSLSIHPLHSYICPVYFTALKHLQIFCPLINSARIITAFLF